jgi:hypothetical protein
VCLRGVLTDWLYILHIVLTPGAQVRSQDCEIYGGQGGSGIVFPPSIAPIFIVSKVLDVHLHLYINLVRLTNERILAAFKNLKMGGRLKEKCINFSGGDELLCSRLSEGKLRPWIR